jgi:hypothetical protein
MYSGRGNAAFATLGFPIRTSPAQRSVGNSPELFAATHVLLRLLAPRHPPHALSSLLTLISRKPASRRILQNSRPRSRPQLFAADPEECIRLSHPLPARLASRLSSPSTGESNFSQQKLNSTLRMHLSKNASNPLVGILVELIGIEPTTSSLQSWRSPS